MAKNSADVGVKTFNIIRQESSSLFQDVVPLATDSNITDLSNILFSNNYQPQLNEFVTNLINRIALTRIESKSFNNPLNIFKKGSLVLGTDIQLLYENPAIAKQYELSNTAMARILQITDPDTQVAYLRRNRKEYYTKSISRENLQGAFVSWDKFTQYIDEITNSLYSGNYIDEFNLTKSLIDSVYDEGKVLVETVSAVTDESTAKAFVKKCRELFTLMKFPSTNYNSYSKMSTTGKTVTTWTDESRICLILPAKVVSEVDVEVLARAFNMDKANFIGRVFTVDKFDNPAIQGVICDEAFIQIYDNLLRFDESYNAVTMVWNEYLHVWGTYALSPFANAIVLATEQPVPATVITIPNTSVVVDNNASITVTLTPSNSTSDIEYSSGDESIFTVTKVDNKHVTVTGVSEGSATLTGTSDTGIIGTGTITVTAS